MVDVECNIHSAHGIHYLSNSALGRHYVEYDWTKTKLPLLMFWPTELKNSVAVALTSKAPMAILWGPELSMLFNDAYLEAVSDDDRHIIGRPAEQIYPEIWHIIGPIINSVYQKGESHFSVDQLLPLQIQGFLTERYFTFSHSPICTENGVEGVHLCLADVTMNVIGNRQLWLLRELAAKSAEAHTTAEAVKITIDGLTTDPTDIPFASLYLISKSKEAQLCLEGTTGIPNYNLTPTEIVLSQLSDNIIVNAMVRVATKGQEEILELTSFEVPACGHWNTSPTHCTVYPIIIPGHENPIGILILGRNQLRRWDETYQTFGKLIVGQVATIFANARAHEEERQRAEQLAEFDRAKTTFFSNISHEFRTPLTLMLGPLEDMMSACSTDIDTITMDNLNIIHRNTLRLLKLVNTLLDFSRIEAGRMTATFVPTDLAKYTEDLASTFRAGCEKVGLQYIVTIETINEPVFVDEDMWEKIVLNLISNAYKYTMNGEISITLRKSSSVNAVELIVSDTGVGIPEKDIPHLLERFYRVHGTTGREHEGTGIGLALVNELVKMHGGAISVKSLLGQGSTFIVSIPLGHEHLPTQFVKNTRESSSESLYSKSTQWWLPNAPNEESQISLQLQSASEDRETRDKVLFVDDNPDMREYVGRMLKNYYAVELACDGEDGLSKAIRNLPNLILSDIMMPRLDGYGLLKKLRAHPKTRTIPVIFLSARAGEEPQTEGLELGADDYLVKPFTSRELLARIKANIDMSKFRIEMTKLEEANEAKDYFLAALSHELRTPLTPVLLLAESLELSEELPLSIQEDIALIKRNISLEIRLIDDLLDLTRITKGKLEMHMEDISLHNLLKYTIQLLEHDINEKELRLHWDLSASIDNVRGDPSRIQQILWNIVKNAIKFTPIKGNIFLETRTVENNRVQVNVRDTGIGFSSNFLSKIFSAFEQEQGSQFGGLGLGLNISRALAIMHNGSLIATSEGIGKGAIFSLELPIEQHRQSSLTTNPQTAQPKVQRSLRILLVEDNKPTLLILKRLLTRLNYLVAPASSVTEALQIASTEDGKFDLVISDIGLPDRSGLELMKELKALYGLKGIAISGYGMEEDVRKSLASGFKIHLTKPVQMAVLSRAIDLVLTQEQKI